LIYTKIKILNVFIILSYSRLDEVRILENRIYKNWVLHVCIYKNTLVLYYKGIIAHDYECNGEYISRSQFLIAAVFSDAYKSYHYVYWRVYIVFSY